MARQTGRAAGGPLKQLALEPGGKPGQLAAETARACAPVDPALKARNGTRALPANARLHQNIHYGAPSWPYVTEPITAQNGGYSRDCHYWLTTLCDQLPGRDVCVPRVAGYAQRVAGSGHR